MNCGIAVMGRGLEVLCSWVLRIPQVPMPLKRLPPLRARARAITGRAHSVLKQLPRLFRLATWISQPGIWGEFARDVSPRRGSRRILRGDGAIILLETDFQRYL